MSRQTAKQSKRGFTIIELLIVLAVASFILLMVIIAFRQLQRNRRDTERKLFADRVLAAIQEFYGNNRRNPDPSIPTDVTRFVTAYLPQMNDPSTGKPYTLQSVDPSLPSNTFEYRDIREPHRDVPPIGTVYIQYAHWCNRGTGPGVERVSDPIAGTDVDMSVYVVWIGTEAGAFYCVDNYNR